MDIQDQFLKELRDLSEVSSKIGCYLVFNGLFTAN